MAPESAKGVSTPVANRAEDRSAIRSWWLGIIAFILVAAALNATQWVTMPLGFAFVVAMCLSPIDLWVCARVPRKFRWMGKLAAVAVILLVIALFVGGAYFVARSVVDTLPSITDQLRAKLPDGNEGGGMFREVWRSVDSVLGTAGGDGAPSGLIGQLGSFARAIASSVSTLLAMAAVIFFFSLLMLTERRRWQEKLRHVSSRNGQWEAAFAAAAQRFRWYLLVRTILGVATAALYGGWLFLFGIELVPVWVILTFLLNFIPTIGSLISGLLPFVFALAAKDLGTAFLVGAGLVFIEQVMGNFVDPRMQGKELSLSPLVLLSSLLLWGFIWGVAGTLIAVPLTVFAVIILARIPALRPIALLLSGETDYPSLDKAVAPHD